MTRSRKDFDRTADMTTGSISRHLISFALPLLVGNFFQLLYNMVDTWVVGNYVSNEAFSAVGTVGPIINMLIGFFMGFSSGAGVVISQYFGAHQTKEVSRTVHTSMLVTLLLSVIFTFLGIFLTPCMVRLMKTPDEVFPQSCQYLTIYFTGVTGLLIYNMGAGILRAVGDSQRPFYFLVVTALCNIVLDLLFVLYFRMGVAGVAWATVISELISAVLVVIVLLKSDAAIHLDLRRLRLDLPILKQIFSVGIPAALQMTITSFSNIIVQSYINAFGADCMSGWTAYTKMDQLLVLPMQSVSLAATTFVGQNLGAGQTARARKGTHTALLLSEISTVALMIPLLIYAPYTVRFFNAKPEVITYGTMFIRSLTPFYVLCCANQVYAGSLRGAGNSRAPMLIMLLSFVAFRQVYLYIMSHYIANEILPIAMGYPAGWIVCSAAMMIYYHFTDLSKTKLTSQKTT